jgi:hypothetical protein
MLCFMVAVKDTSARLVAVAALVVALGAYTLGSANADSSTEPDAAILAGQVATLQAQVDDLTVRVGAIEGLATRVGDLEDSSAVIDCLAYSDFHYYKERVSKHGAKVRLPVMVWNAAKSECRPTAAPWRPALRALVPVR